jgi:copper(I)-binding protein
MKRLIWVSVSLLLLACSSPEPEHQLLFENAWVRAMPPGSMMTAGFGRLLNKSGIDLEISTYTSPQFEEVSLHRTIQENGVSRMQPVPALKIPAGTNLELAPGGFHLMFMGPAQKIERVIRVQIELTDGRQFSFELPVERR